MLGKCWHVSDATRRNPAFLVEFDKIRKNNSLIEHIFKGDYRKTTGCHVRSCVDGINIRFEGGRIPEGTSLGVLKGDIEIRKELFDPNNGGKPFSPPQYKWVKKNTQGEPQTFFPSTWSEGMVLEQCASAFTNPKKTFATKPDGSLYSRMYEAESDSGVFIRWFVDPNGNPISFFPEF